MRKHLHDYHTIFEDELNTDLMNRVYDRPLVEFIIEAWKSLEIVEGIKILDWDFQTKESEIDFNRYLAKRKRAKKQKDKFDSKMIKDSRLGLLTVTVQITLEKRDPSSGYIEQRSSIINPSMLIPLQDEKGMFRINGKDIYLIFQMLEKSTYTNKNGVTLKSLMPFSVQRSILRDVQNEDGEKFNIPFYSLDLFKKPVPVMLIYATNGMDWALQFALESPYMVMDFVKEAVADDPKYMYFKISTTVYLRVRRDLFKEFTYVQSVVAGILFITSNHTTMKDLNNPNVWLKKLGGSNIAKGENLLIRAKRLLDVTIGTVLRLDWYHKQDVYTLTRWMCQEFNDLRMKDNMDLHNKRLRSNEIFEALIAQEFSNRINRIMSLGQKADLSKYEEIFTFSPDILLQAINNSGIQRYNDCINDMDFFTKFKYTMKGPNAHGNKNRKRLSDKYRGLHYSFIGRVDLTVCGNSDPGTSGLLSPFGKMDGLYFDDSPEPDDFILDFHNRLCEIAKEEGVACIEVDFKDKDDFYHMIDKIRKLEGDGVQVISTSKIDDQKIVYAPEEKDLYATQEETAAKKAKGRKKAAENKEGE